MYGISITFHQFFLTLKIFYIKIKKFSIKSWTRRTYIYVANTFFFDLRYLPIGQKCFSLLGKITQAKEFKRKKFLKTLLDVDGEPFCLSLGSSGKT